MYAEQVAIQIDYVQIAAITLQIRAYVGIEQRADRRHARFIFRT